MSKISMLMGGLAALCLVACDSGVEGNGERTDELRETATFSRVRSDCSLDVETVQGDATSVTVSLDSNLQPLVRTRVEGDTLYVESDESFEDMVTGPHVRITVPMLSAAKLAGSGRMAFWLDQPSATLDLTLSGSGALRYEGRAAGLGAYLSGSGNIQLLGEAPNLDVELSGSGAVRARDLLAERAQIELSGSGDVTANANDSFSVSLSGSGDIDLYGGGSIDGYRNSGSGNITEH